MDFCQALIAQAQAVFAAARDRLVALSGLTAQLLAAADNAVSKFCPGTDPASTNCCDQWRAVRTFLGGQPPLGVGGVCADEITVQTAIDALQAALAAMDCSSPNADTLMDGLRAAMGGVYGAVAAFENDLAIAYRMGANLNPGCPCNTPGAG